MIGRATVHSDDEGVLGDCIRIGTDGYDDDAAPGDDEGGEDRGRRQEA